MENKGYLQDRAVWQIRIDSAKNTLTASERRIAEYFLDNPDAVVRGTITEVAEACDTSEATMVRFCRHVGYKGFQDIKIAVAQSRVPSLQVMYDGISENSSISEVKQCVFSSSISAMRETHEILDDRELERAAEALYRARTIDIYGMGNSYVVAEDAKHQFLKIGLRCQIYNDSHLQMMSAAQLKKGDVAFGISYSGSSRDVVEAMTLAKRNGATTIALTHNAKTPLSSTADIVLNVTGRDSAFRSDSIVSRMAQVAVIDVLYASIGLKKGQEALDILECGRKATSSKSC